MGKKIQSYKLKYRFVEHHWVLRKSSVHNFNMMKSRKTEN